MDEVFNIISKEELYEHTGIQFQQFNTIYQLYEMSKRIDLKKANHFLMIPDYMIYLLTGVTVNEYTNATTTQLLNAKTHMWDETILERLHIPVSYTHLFQKKNAKPSLRKAEQTTVSKTNKLLFVIRSRHKYSLWRLYN